MTSTTLSAEADDTLLVQQSLTGDRQAFGKIVGRYQSLVCALAYSATGSRVRSEDLAQETFLVAWRHLRELRDPGRLRAWLCGVARNVIHGDIRRLQRQPAHEAEVLEDAGPLCATEPLPSAEAIGREEMAILWREVGRLPERYREPLILYYREHQSAEAVAAALELTPDAVMQRLSRGRRLLQDRMLAFVETTLEQTNPGPGFALQVEAALPLIGSSAAAAGTAAPGGLLTKTSLAGVLLAWLAPLVGVFAAIGVSWIDLRQAPTRRERRVTARWLLALWSSAAAFVVTLPVVGRYTDESGFSRHGDWRSTAPLLAVWFGFSFVAVTLITLMLRRKAALRRQTVAEGGAEPRQDSTWRRKGAVALAVLASVYWPLIFVAWKTGDRVVAVAIAVVMLLLVIVPLSIARQRPSPTDDPNAGGWYLAICGSVFLLILNWRLDVWLAPIYDVDLPVMHRLLPTPLIHGLSLFLIGWVAALIRLTRPKKAA